MKRARLSGTLMTGRSTRTLFATDTSTVPSGRQASEDDMVTTAAELDKDLKAPQPPDAQTDLTGIVADAVKGSQPAWNTLLERFGPMVNAIARSCRLSAADVADVHQSTWVRLVENIHRIEQPERIGAWLATTARRESLSVVRSRSRVSFDNNALDYLPDLDIKPPDAGPLADERSSAVREAFAQLPSHCQRLLNILSSSDPPSYREISTTLDMPIGSIGPTRGRCLAHLRRILEEQGADV
jgi:RNA polymerase sigma factor (sigma-70 family)